jgi:hypothetical protein
MRGLRFVIAIGGVMAAAGCSRSTPVHEAAYYLAHPAERTAAIAACAENSGDEGRTSNCINAMSAAAHIEQGGFWKTQAPKSRLAHPGSL